LVFKTQVHRQLSSRIPMIVESQGQHGLQM